MRFGTVDGREWNFRPDLDDSDLDFWDYMRGNGLWPIPADSDNDIDTLVGIIPAHVVWVKE